MRGYIVITITWGSGGLGSSQPDFSNPPDPVESGCAGSLRPDSPVNPNPFSGYVSLRDLAVKKTNPPYS
jgi:hypothetical protein